MLLVGVGDAPVEQRGVQPPVGRRDRPQRLETGPLGEHRRRDELELDEIAERRPGQQVPVELRPRQLLADPRGHLLVLADRHARARPSTSAARPVPRGVRRAAPPAAPRGACRDADRASGRRVRSRRWRRPGGRCSRCRAGRGAGRRRQRTTRTQVLQVRDDGCPHPPRAARRPLDVPVSPPGSTLPSRPPSRTPSSVPRSSARRSSVLTSSSPRWLGRWSRPP